MAVILRFRTDNCHLCVSNFVLEALKTVHLTVNLLLNYRNRFHVAFCHVIKTTTHKTHTNFCDLSAKQIKFSPKRVDSYKKTSSSFFTMNKFIIWMNRTAGSNGALFVTSMSRRLALLVMSPLMTLMVNS